MPDIAVTLTFQDEDEAKQISAELEEMAGEDIYYVEGANPLSTELRVSVPDGPTEPAERALTRVGQFLRGAQERAELTDVKVSCTTAMWPGSS